MARYVCPSCGAFYNGKKCRQCCYEHFSEEIAHGGHTHRGEPLVIDAPTRRPIPKKDPFGCEKKSRRAYRPKEKKQRPFAGLMSIFLVIYALLPLVRDWGLELEAREEAAPEPVPASLVTLYEEGDFTFSVQKEQIGDFDEGLRIWVKNDSEEDCYVNARTVTANGFAMQYRNLYVDAAAESWGMGTLYLDQNELEAAFIEDVRELSFSLEVVSDESYRVLLVTPPLGLSTGESVETPEISGALPLIDDAGIVMEYLGHWSEPGAPYEEGQLRFYLENNTEETLSVTSLAVSIGGEDTELYLWAELPPGTKAVAAMDLWDLKIETSPTELGDLEMTVEFFNWEDYSASSRTYTVTAPMVNPEPLVVSWPEGV